MPRNNDPDGMEDVHNGEVRHVPGHAVLAWTGYLDTASVNDCYENLISEDKFNIYAPANNKKYIFLIARPRHYCLENHILVNM